MALKAKTVTREMVKILALGMEEGGEAAAKALPPVYAGDAPDYSLVDCWVQVPEITKDVDTFYIFSTSYVESSFAEGAPDYARLDNPEMVYGALDEYVSNASAFEDSTNVFVPYYRQAGIRYAQESRDKTGGIDANATGSSPRSGWPRHEETLTTVHSISLQAHLLRGGLLAPKAIKTRLPGT